MGNPLDIDIHTLNLPAEMCRAIVVEVGTAWAGQLDGTSAESSILFRGIHPHSYPVMLVLAAMDAHVTYLRFRTHATMT